MLLILLAVLPDFDYFAIWFFHIDVHPRITHTLMFCLSAAAIAWLVATPYRHQSINVPEFLSLSLAACSHLLLDLLVGVHGLPLLWPFSPTEITIPIGLLPSAGRLSVTNYYLWRNLLIEVGVLFPILTIIVSVCRGRTLRTLLAKSWPLLLLWSGALYWSVSLGR